MHRRVRKALIGVLSVMLILPVLALVLIESADRILSTERGARWYYRNVPYDPEIRFSDSGIRYMTIGSDDKPALLLLHGSPGGLSDWRALAKSGDVLEQYRLIIAERPGYGATKPRFAEASIEQQARRLADWIQSWNEPLVIMGYSYGAPVGLALAGILPDQVQAFYGIAGQYDPDQEIVFGISHWVRAGVFRWLMPRWLWVSNVEKLGHAQALREVKPLFDAVTCPVWLLHGRVDAIVPYENSPWLSREITAPVQVRSLDEIGHELPFRHMDTVIHWFLEHSPREHSPRENSSSVLNLAH